MLVDKHTKETKMKTILAIAAVAIAAFIVVPALKGPYNRFKNEANEKLDAEFVVDNYKAEYVKLSQQRARVLESLNRFEVEKRVAQKKHAHAAAELSTAKSFLKSIGTSDMEAFNRAKSTYELARARAENFGTMAVTYEHAVKKLEKTLALVDSNMSKAKMNVDTLSSKKTMLDTMKVVNEAIENVSGVGDPSLATSVEKLDDDMLRESVKLEALGQQDPGTSAQVATEAEARAYLDSLD